MLVYKVLGASINNVQDIQDGVLERIDDAGMWG